MPGDSIVDHWNSSGNDSYLEPMENCTTAMGAAVTSQGIISMRLHSGVQVDTTIDKGIRVLNAQVKKQF